MSIVPKSVWIVCVLLASGGGPAFGAEHLFDVGRWGEGPSERVTVLRDTGNVDPDVDHQPLEVADLNGDGCDDLAYARVGSSADGAPEAERTGEVVIRMGARESWQPSGGCSPEVLEYRISGIPGDLFGWDMALEDLNADGLADLIVSAPARATPSRENVGAVYIWLGGPNALGGQETSTPSGADVALLGLAASEWLGYSVAPAGDLVSSEGRFGGDGVADLWVAAMGGDRIFLLPGDQGWKRGGIQDQLSSEDARTRGVEVDAQACGTGDYFAWQMQTRDGEAGAELLVTFPYCQRGPGQAYLLPLEAGAVSLDEARLVMEGASGSSLFGWSILDLAGPDGPLEHLWLSEPSVSGEAAEGHHQGRLSSPDASRRLVDADYAGAQLGTLGLGVALAPFPGLEANDALADALIGNAGMCGSSETYNAIAGRVTLALSTELEAAPPGESELSGFVAWQSAAQDDCFGVALRPGDFNGDGELDLAVSALNAEGGAGTLTILWSVSLLRDSDGDGAMPYPGFDADRRDCDDTRNDRAPGLEEVCDGVDNDCDDILDEGVTWTFYVDLDGDGSGTTTQTVQACEAPVGYAVAAGDCRDEDPTFYPGVTELCDGMDNDCDGVVPEEEADSDHDGWRVCDGDADDRDANTWPGAAERCDGRDNDQDGEVDEEAVDPATWYRDEDGDGWGDVTRSISACGVPDGYGSSAGDCDDRDPCRYPGERQGTWDRAFACPVPVAGLDQSDLDCDGDAFTSRLWEADLEPKLESGCGAIDLGNGLAGLMLPLWPILWRRRRA